MHRRRLKKSVKISLVVTTLILTIFIFILSTYYFMLSPVNKKNNEIIEVTISSGERIIDIVNKLKDKNLIRSDFFVRAHLKLSRTDNLQAGTYDIKQSYSSKEIINMISKGKISTKDEINITFKEGINIRDIANVISEKTNNNESDVFDLLNDESYLDDLTNNYWFITEEIKNNNLHYSLEGYLYPNTYKFDNKDVSVKLIFASMLNQMDKVLSEYREDIESLGFSFHELLTFASIVESEGIKDSDRKMIAGVFYNRLNRRIPFQSCVTACYALKIDECIPKNIPTEYVSPYNTYLYSTAGNLPVGPVSIPSSESIIATIFPESHDYLFFLSDKNNVTYFSKTDSEHTKKIAELRQKGLWH